MHVSELEEEEQNTSDLRIIYNLVVAYFIALIVVDGN